MNITVFGGSQLKESDRLYSEAYALGKLLAQAGHNVLTGGYIGSMEAVSRGANEAGGHVIGVTCADIETWRPVRANAWVKEERRFSTLQQRLNELITACDAAIALPGGPGTLAEVALTWNLMILNSIPAKTLILIGESWKGVLDSFFVSFDPFIPGKQRSLITFASNVQEAVQLLPGFRSPVF
jgi:uncharacterized protein (TIGR00730 family)